MVGSAVACVGIVVALAWQAPKSNRALALALAAHMAPADTVVMVDEYFYDVPFYARLTHPVVIASNWADPELPTRDNWRKEVFDAARFDPALGRELLQPLDRLDALAAAPAPSGSSCRPRHAARVPRSSRRDAHVRRSARRALAPGRGRTGSPGPIEATSSATPPSARSRPRCTTWC